MDVEFADEQRRLAGACWQLIGTREQLAAPNSWLRRTVFGTDIFVQNFAGELRGYHNVCAHRGFPLRLADHGVGPVQCGFHGWVYNRDGVPTGIPRNAEMFPISREQQVGLALPAVRIESIGRFVFAALSAGVPPLVEYLGRYAAVFRTLDGMLLPLLDVRAKPSAANWKLHVEITLDDYHLATVHPHTFGTGDPQPLHRFYYQRDGIHSAMLKRRDPDWSFDGFWADVAAGTYDRTGYKIYNCFPNLLISTTPADCIISVTHPVGPRASSTEIFVLGWTDTPTTPEATRAGVDYVWNTLREDQGACETWQLAVDQLGHPPVLGKFEQRVGWFRESLAQVLGR
jgi:phenylpropionate dioxygenase-like ring-hydroxylating dioxygenase large terminal subunit